MKQPLSRGVQVSLTEDAHRRIKVEAAKKDSSLGRIISELAVEHLPIVEDAA